MCFKSSPYLHQKSTNCALDMVFLCFGTNVAHEINVNLSQIAPKSTAENWWK